jgi:hypothetical protein
MRIHDGSAPVDAPHPTSVSCAIVSAASQGKHPHERVICDRPNAAQHQVLSLIMRKRAPMIRTTVVVTGISTLLRKDTIVARNWSPHQPLRRWSRLRSFPCLVRDNRMKSAKNKIRKRFSWIQRLATFFLTSTCLTPTHADQLIATDGSLPIISQGGFEQPDLAAATFVYGQLGGIGPTWEYPNGSANGAGVAANGSAISGAQAPEGDQVLFVQGGPTSIAKQTFRLGQSGKLRLSLKAALRPDGSQQTVTISVDGSVVGSVTPPSSTSFTPYAFTFPLLAGTHVLQFAGTSNLAHTALVDDVQLVFASLEQGGFELPDVPANAFSYRPSGSAWEFPGGAANAAGFSASGALFGNAPEGDQFLFVQGGASSLARQNFTVTSSGRYRLSLKSAQRADDGSQQVLKLRIDGVERGTIAPPATTYSTFSFALDLNKGAHIIELLGQSNLGHTAFVDDVKLEPDSYLQQSGFEIPVLPPSNVAYHPTGSAWQFPGGSANSAGITSNGSGFGTTAPEGNQVLFLHGGTNGFARQSFDVQIGGRFRLAFKSAQRVGSIQTIQLRLDGTELGRTTPTGTTYQSYLFDSLLLAPGTHTIEFVGTDELHGYAAFVDDVRLSRVDAVARRWSDPATWLAGRPPEEGDDVIIPEGAVVLIDAAASAKNVDIQGELHCADQDISLTTGSILVTGRLACGARYSPFVNRFTVTLKESGSEDSIMGTKFVAAMGLGVIELHGKPRKSWTRLAATPAPPYTQLMLAEPTDWRVGDQIVVAPTQAAAHEGEVVTVSTMIGNTVTVTPALANKHSGTQSTYSNGVDSWTLDERAEVGLLSRNILIQGDDDQSTENGLGGHMMTMAGSAIRASGIELYRMGQKESFGRYPFHWHLVGSAAGQYIVNSSIHKSFNRCVTVHGTHDTLVADNVCYDFLGHGYFLEDGIEQRNVFDGNLAVWARRPLPSEELLETDKRESPASNGPAAFWISNPNNKFVNNAAAGSEGTGYWYHTEHFVTGQSAVPGSVPYEPGYQPNTAPFGVFDNNSVRASRQGFSSCRDTGGAAGLDSANAVIRRLTVTNVTQGIWPCAANTTTMNTVFERAITANTPNGMQAPSPMTFRDSAFIAYTNNPRTEINAEKYGIWRAIPVYDQGFMLDRVHFVNYDKPNLTVFEVSGGVHKLTGNRARGLTFTNSPNLFLDQENRATSYMNMVARGDVINDLDGSLIGQGKALVSNHPLMSDATCSRAAGVGIFGYACPYRYAHFRLDGGISNGQAPRATVIRSDGVHDSGFLIDWRILNEFILAGPYSYSYRLDGGLDRYTLTATTQGGHAGDTSIHEILDVPSTFAFPTGSIWSSATTLDQLKQGPGHRYYYRAESASLYLKMQPSGSDWNAFDSAAFCLTSYDSKGVCCPVESDANQICPEKKRPVAPPGVNITSPADGARIAANTSFTVTATASAPTGIISAHLFANDQLLGQTTGTSISIPSSLPQGSYALKLVVKAANMQTYTAVQQLVVGIPGPSVKIVSFADDSTFAVGAIPNLSLDVNGWAIQPGGRHLHWYDNGVDQGHLYSTTTALAQLTAGKHIIEAALVEANETKLAVADEATIYVTANNILAEFEDGIDTRGLLKPHGVGTQPEPPLYAFDSAFFGLADLEDDVNYFPLTGLDDGVSTLATYRFDIFPRQDWTSFSALEIRYGGDAFEAILVLENGNRLSLGNALPTMYGTRQFSIPSGLTSQVAAVELRYSELSSTDAVGYLYRLRLIP